MFRDVNSYVCTLVRTEDSREGKKTRRPEERATNSPSVLLGGMRKFTPLIVRLISRESNHEAQLSARLRKTLRKCLHRSGPPWLPHRLARVVEVATKD